MATLNFTPTQHLLGIPITREHFSEGFVHYAHANHWKTLGDIIAIPFRELVYDRGLSTPCCEELVGLLERHQRLYLLDITTSK